MGTGEINAGGPILRGVEILPVRNRVKLRPDGSLGLYADLTFNNRFA